MNIVFRADASYRIGAGHVTRCLTLADVLADQGGQCCFVYRHLPESLAARIHSRGHELIQLPTTHVRDDDVNAVMHAQWLGTSQEDDSKHTRDALRGRRCDWLIVDHYALDVRWERELREIASGIMVIDDLADRPHECDLLLDQNYYADFPTRYEGLVTRNTRCLLGPEYALLHPQFAAARGGSSGERPERLFVSVGSNDPCRICVKVGAALRSPVLKLLEADIVAGTDIAVLNDTRASVGDLPGVRVHGFINDIAACMARCTVAIGAAGSSTWERCAIGLPSIVVVTADNQRQLAADLARTGVVVLLGEGADVSAEMLGGAIADLIRDPARRSRMRLDAMNLVDGQGAYRVTKRMLEMM